MTQNYASFLFSFVGRGIFYIFIGTLLLHDHVLRIVAGSIIGVIGAIYIVAEFVPGIEKPESMALQTGNYEEATETL